jgi:hypothetical protein
MNDVADIAEDARRGYPPRISEVQFACPAKRRRGAPLGNGNRLKHGAFSQAAVRRRGEIYALVAKGEALVVRAGMVAKARKALKRRQKYLAAKPVPLLSASARFLAALPKWLAESWLTRETARAPPLSRMC